MWRVRDRGNKPWNPSPQARCFPSSVDEFGGKPWNPCKPWNTGLNLITECLPSSVRMAMRKKAKEMMTQSDDNSNQKPDSESHQDKLSEATTSMPQSRSLTLLFSPDSECTSPRLLRLKRKEERQEGRRQQVMKKVKATT